MELYELRQKEELFFKVRRENETNKVLNNVVPKLLNVFKGEEGKQLLKVGGSVCCAYLFKKYSDKINDILREVEKETSNEKIHISLSLSVDIYSIFVSVKARFNNIEERGFLYYDNYKYLVDLKDLKINRFYEFKPVEEINPEEQYKTFLNCLDLLNKLNEEKAKLKPYKLKEMVK